MDYGNTKAPSMHRRLGIATLSQLAFPEESGPNFPLQKSQRNNTVITGKSGLLIGWGFRVIAFSALSGVFLKCYVDAQLILVYLI